MSGLGCQDFLSLGASSTWGYWCPRSTLICPAHPIVEATRIHGLCLPLFDGVEQKITITCTGKNFIYLQNIKKQNCSTYCVLSAVPILHLRKIRQAELQKLVIQHHWQKWGTNAGSQSQSEVLCCFAAPKVTQANLLLYSMSCSVKSSQHMVRLWKC